jgi:hypothetical protein
MVKSRRNGQVQSVVERPDHVANTGGARSPL